VGGDLQLGVFVDAEGFEERLVEDEGERVSGASQLLDHRTDNIAVWYVRSTCDNLVSSMPIAPGTRLGPYEITSQIGAGGMGEVFRARDTRLGRAVAIKVLREEF